MFDKRRGTADTAIEAAILPRAYRRQSTRECKIEAAPKQLAEFRWHQTGPELRFEVVDLAGQQTLDGCRIDWLHAGLGPGFKRTDKMATDLERGLELDGERDGGVLGQQYVRLDPRRQRGAHGPIDVIALPVARTAKLDHGCPIADFFR